ncbi:MAG: chromate transporter [Spirochaetales bacterium]|nr:chromate transporter [Spirochaetales bacterium]
MEDIKKTEVRLGAIFWAYFKVGLTAFGFAILQKLKSLVKKSGWLTETELNEGLVLVQLYLGAIMVNLTTYVGYKKRDLPGAIATSAFITPTMIFMLALSSVYFSFGKMP